jgi:hypothetical protein
MREANRSGVRIGRRGTGFVAEAPRFYLWDEDPEHLARTAREFASSEGMVLSRNCAMREESSEA